jgi:hypothetical protein
MPIRRLSKLPPLIAAAAIATATGLTAAPPAHAADFIVNLMSVQNSKCLQPLNGSSEAGAAIVQEICNGSLVQQWTSAPHGSAISLTNGASGMCLDARGKSAAGTPIQQWPCAPGGGISNQFWNYSGNGNQLVSEVNPSPNRYCLATPGNGDGNPMALQPCDGKNQQQQWNHPLSAPVVSSSGNLYVALPTEEPITPNSQEIQTEVLWVGDWLKPGEIRRVTDQLAIRITDGNEAQLNNRIECFDDEGATVPPGASSGTNYPNAGGQDYQWNGSTLLVNNGPSRAFFNCQILVYTNHPQTFAVPPQAPLNLISGQNGKCLQPLNGSSEAGAAIVQATCNGSPAQQWTSAPHGFAISLTNVASGMCLDARGKSAAGTPIQQWPCAAGAAGEGISNQFWNYGANGNELVSEVSPSPDSYCLATSGNDDGNPMALQLCDGNPPQLWDHPSSTGRQTTYGTWLQMSSSDQVDAQVWVFPVFECPPDDKNKLPVCTYIDKQSPLSIIPTTLKLISVQNGKCLQPLNGSPGAAIVQATCNNGSPAQLWASPLPADSKGMSFINQASGMCLDARGKSAAGTPIQHWPCALGEGISNQFWKYGANGNELVSEVNPSPNRYCLAAPGNDDGTPMELQPCNGSPPQLWNHPSSTGQSFEVDNNVTAIDGEATMQVTTCDNGTSTCKDSVSGHGSYNGSAGEAFLEFNQLNPDGSTCQVNRVYSEVDGKPVLDEQFGVDNHQHHLPLFWHVTAPVSQLCNGSRAFSADLHMQYANGNPIKLEGANINFINSATAPTTTVPSVIGLTEQQASAAIVAAGLYMAAPAYVTAIAPPGTVLAQNSPGGTIEPTGSPVQITVSLREDDRPGRGQ